ncbi:unnamed protein product [Caenorhabditis auriculariae]|uniref:tRNA:m(4)X modification enzyme TRM13 n=1 Tax=Caenorhabditis auriculariae TaxID=2777116 RepID=A0A8S1GSW8_9PELO|nr:unnamed protein product [Caenorhabditis auriculariae]
MIADDGRCTYVLPKKKRRCRMLVKSGKLFCGEHAIFDVQNEDRIPCPIDTKHTVLKSELEAHLKRCNARIGAEEWIDPDSNAIKGETRHNEKIDRRPSEEEILEIVEKVWTCYEDFVQSRLVVSQKTHSLVEKFLEENPELGQAKRKHLVQISSIVGHLLENNLLPTEPSTCMFELGAGKAQLAYWIAKAAPEGSYLLMDRSGARNKWDNRALSETPELRMKRLRCSIEHLDLRKVDWLQDAEKLFAVCKHFCGSATDAGIRCLLNASSKGIRFDSALLVPCCHHKSRYDEYIGREFLGNWQLDSLEAFSALRYIASFATNGADLRCSEAREIGQSTWRDRYPPTELGRRAKAILEMGRAEWLRSVGYETTVIEYVPARVSPENLLILAKRSS